MEEMSWLLGLEHLGSALVGKVLERAFFRTPQPSSLQVICKCSKSSFSGLIPCLKTRGTLLLSRQNLHSGVYGKYLPRGRTERQPPDVRPGAHLSPVPETYKTKAKICALGLPVSICPRWGWDLSLWLAAQDHTEPTSPGTTLSSNQFSDDCVCLYACMSVRRHAEVVSCVRSFAPHGLSLLCSPVHGLSRQALEWLLCPPSRGFFLPRD